MYLPKGLEVLSRSIGGSLIVRGRHFVLSSIVQHRSEIGNQISITFLYNILLILLLL